MSQTGPRVAVRTDGPIGWIEFDNPRRHNAMTVAMWAALGAAVEALEADDAVRVVVLRGAGETAFVSGADISQFDDLRASAEANEHYEAVGDDAMARVAACAKPTIAMLQGWCLGGGVAIALACDLRLADASLRFGIPAARLGVAYRWRGIAKLVQVVGAPNAREVFLTARRFDAQAALRMGFVARVVERGALEAAVREECATIAANAPLSMASFKVAMAELLAPGPQVDVARVEAAARRAFDSADYVEGRRAFADKRAPRFEGR
jgi:enoyl-CoA hydratase/carnithine racemase